VTSIFDPIIVRIEDATSTANNASSGVSGGGASSGGKGGGAAGVAAGLTAVVSIVGEILGLVKGAVDGVLKPVRTVLSGILKLIAQLLRPIVDVLMIALMPILQFLKPIIKVANEIMRPFRVLAYGLMRQASRTDNAVEANALQGLAMASILGGIGNVLIGLTGELIKMIGHIVLDILGSTILMSQDRANELKSGLSGVIDNVTQTIQAQTLAGIMRLSLEVVRGGEKEILEMSDLFKKVTDTASDGVSDKIKGMDFYTELTTLGTLIENEEVSLEGKFGSIGNTIRNGFVTVGDGLVESITDMIRRAERAARLANPGNVARIDDFSNPMDAIDYSNQHHPRRRLLDVKVNI
jgi:hypothetical protein